MDTCVLYIVLFSFRSGAKEINRHLDTLIRHGLEPLDSSCPIDLERVKFTCEVLGRMVPSTKVMNVYDYSFIVC